MNRRGGGEGVVDVDDLREAAREISGILLDRPEPWAALAEYLTRPLATAAGQAATIEAACHDIRDMLRESRRQIQKRVEEAAHPDRVMQIVMAFFPLAPSEAAR